MANPFKEAEKAKKVAPGAKKPPVVENTEENVAPVVAETPVEVAPVVEKVVAPVVAEQVTAQPKAEKKPAKVANKIEALLGPAQKAKKQERSTIAVYLSKENKIQGIIAIFENDYKAAAELFSHARKLGLNKTKEH